MEQTEEWENPWEKLLFLSFGLKWGGGSSNKQNVQFCFPVPEVCMGF